MYTSKMENKVYRIFKRQGNRFVALDDMVFETYGLAYRYRNENKIPSTSVTISYLDEEDYNYRHREKLKNKYSDVKELLDKLSDKIDQVDRQLDNMRAIYNTLRYEIDKIEK